MDKKEIKVAECFGIDMKDRLCVVDRNRYRLESIRHSLRTTGQGDTGSFKEKKSVAVLGVHGDDGSSSSSSSSSGSSSNRRNRLTHYPVLVPPRWPVFVVVVGLVLVPYGEDWIVSAPARCLLMVLVEGRASYRRC
ncbi:hypothetical protein QQG55_27400 [Brugia pahangi]